MQKQFKTFSKNDLLERWIAKYPSDKRCPDLHQKALAGYVQLKNGRYIEYGLYRLFKNIFFNEGKENVT